MENQLIIKLKIASIALVGLMMGYVTYPLIKPVIADDVISIVMHDRSVLIFIVGLILSVISGGIAGFISKMHGRNYALLAVPLFLICWAYHSGSIEGPVRLLESPEQKAGLFYKLLFDTILWSLMLASGYLIACIINKHQPESGLKDNSAKSNSDKGTKNSNSTLINNGICVGLSAIIAVFIIRFLCQSNVGWIQGLQGMPEYEVKTVPAIAQGVSSVFLAFFISSYVIKQFALKFFRGISVEYLLITPLVVGVILYAYGAFQVVPGEILNQSPGFVLSSHAFYYILPVHLISIGSIAVIAGYYSFIPEELLETGAVSYNK